MTSRRLCVVFLMLLLAPAAALSSSKLIVKETAWTSAGKGRGILEAKLSVSDAGKLRAIEELTHEDLRADTSFSIFLQQCANLTRKIQSKIAYVARGQAYPKAAPPPDASP